MGTNYNNLDIFHLAYNFVLDLYPILDRFPEGEHKNLVLQMKRAAISMPSNIAEGSSRRNDREFLPFLSYTLGSAKEIEVCLRLSKDLHFVDEGTFETMNSRLQTFIGKLLTLMRYLEDNLTRNKKVKMARLSRGENVGFG